MQNHRSNGRGREQRNTYRREMRADARAEADRHRSTRRTSKDPRLNAPWRRPRIRACHSSCRRTASAFMATSRAPLAAPRSISTAVKSARFVVRSINGSAAGNNNTAPLHTAISLTRRKRRVTSSIAGTEPSKASPNSESERARRSFTSGIRGAQLDSTAPLTKKTSQRLETTKNVTT